MNSVGEHGSRRHALRVLGRLTGAGVLGALTSCGEAQPAELRLPLSQVPVGARQDLQLGGTPIELLRTEAGVEARSLLCPHMGCRVVWRDQEGEYFCPCHEGRFDPEGTVVSGPPPKPLRQIPARIEGDQIVVGPGDRLSPAASP